MIKISSVEWRVNHTSEAIFDEHLWLAEHKNSRKRKPETVIQIQIDPPTICTPTPLETPQIKPSHGRPYGDHTASLIETVCNNKMMRNFVESRITDAAKKLRNQMKKVSAVEKLTK